MRRITFTEEQIVWALREPKAVASTGELSRRLGVSRETLQVVGKVRAATGVLKTLAVRFTGFSRSWARARSARVDFLQPGKPMPNGFLSTVPSATTA